MGGTSMEEVRGASFAGSSPPFLGRGQAAVDVERENDGENTMVMRETRETMICIENMV